MPTMPPHGKKTGRGDEKQMIWKTLFSIMLSCILLTMLYAIILSVTINWYVIFVYIIAGLMVLITYKAMKEV